MSEYKARFLSESDYPQWDALVEQSGQGTIFHSSGWITTVTKMFPVKSTIIGVFRNSDLIGGCLFYQENLFHLYHKGTTDIAMTSYGGFVISSPLSIQVRECEKREHQIISLILDKIQSLNLANVRLTNSPGLVDIRPFTWKGWNISVSYNYIFPLLCTIEEKISRKARWSINKAKKSGVMVRQKWDKDLYWDLTLKMYRQHGSKPPFSRQSLSLFLDHIQDSHCGDMWIAETASGAVAAAEIFIWDSRMAYRWSAASDREYLDANAPSLLLFEIMTHLQKQGFRNYNMMAANIPHLAKFISSFNPDLVPYYSMQRIRGIYRIPGILRQLVSKN